jgi:hypothetical protein
MALGPCNFFRGFIDFLFEMFPTTAPSWFCLILHPLPPFLACKTSVCSYYSVLCDIVYVHLCVLSPLSDSSAGWRLRIWRMRTQLNCCHGNPERYNIPIPVDVFHKIHHGRISVRVYAAFKATELFSWPYLQWNFISFHVSWYLVETLIANYVQLWGISVLSYIHRFVLREFSEFGSGFGSGGTFQSLNKSLRVVSI